MNYKKVASIYSIFIGLSIIVMWIVLLMTDKVPEVKTEPIYFAYYICSEIICSFILILGGIGLFADLQWGKQVHFFSMGMLLYSFLITGAEWAQNKEWAAISLVIRFTILALLFISLFLFKSGMEDEPRYSEHKYKTID